MDVETDELLAAENNPFLGGRKVLRSKTAGWFAFNSRSSSIPLQVYDRCDFSHVLATHKVVTTEKITNTHQTLNKYDTIATVTVAGYGRFGMFSGTVIKMPKPVKSAL